MFSYFFVFFCINLNLNIVYLNRSNYPAGSGHDNDYPGSHLNLIAFFPLENKFEKALDRTLENHADLHPIAITDRAQMPFKMEPDRPNEVTHKFPIICIG